MDYRKANRAFLYIVIATLVFTLQASLLSLYYGFRMGLMANNFFSEMSALLPAVVVVWFHGDSLTEAFNLKKIRFSTVLLTFLYVVLLYPLVLLISSASMFFVENTVAEMSDEIIQMPMWQMFLAIGLFGPFIEEIVFRGILLGSLGRSGRIMGSVLVSSLMFGLVHMNFSQFAYGTIMGIMFALLVEATGSVVTSFIAHATFNSFEVFLMYSTAGVEEEAVRLSSEMFPEGGVLVYFAVYLAMAVICTSLALCVAYKISGIEGRQAFYAGIFKAKKKGLKLITMPAVLGAVLCVIFMGVIEYISRVNFQ